MKNTNQICQFVKNWQKETRAHLSENCYEEIFKEIILTKCGSLLALLPCETCGGTGEIIADGSWGMIHIKIPCPDCQKKPTKRKSSSSTMWEHLH